MKIPITRTVLAAGVLAAAPSPSAGGVSGPLGVSPMGRGGSFARTIADDNARLPLRANTGSLERPALVRREV